MTELNRYEQNKQRNIAARRLVQVPEQVQKFFVELLTHTGKRSDWFRTCITCKHWQESKCTLFNCTPPPEVIVDGCKHYIDFDEIPF